MTAMPLALGAGQNKTSTSNSCQTTPSILLTGLTKNGTTQFPQFHHSKKEMRKQVSLSRSCTLCVQGSVQRQDWAWPHAVSVCLPLSAHSAREGPAPGAQVSSQLDLPWPLAGASDPLGGVEALPRPSSCNVAFDADLVKPKVKRLHETAEVPFPKDVETSRGAVWTMHWSHGGGGGGIGSYPWTGHNNRHATSMNRSH